MSGNPLAPPDGGAAPPPPPPPPEPPPAETTAWPPSPPRLVEAGPTAPTPAAATPSPTPGPTPGPTPSPVLGTPAPAALTTVPPAPTTAPLPETPLSPLTPAPPTPPATESVDPGPAALTLIDPTLTNRPTTGPATDMSATPATPTPAPAPTPTPAAVPAAPSEPLAATVQQTEPTLDIADLTATPTPSLPEGGSNRRAVRVPHRRPAIGRRTRHRSEAMRSRSIGRRANPWYRRAVRSILMVGVLCAVAAGVYYGGRAFEDWRDRAQLPAVGADTPDIRATTFRVLMAQPEIELELDGTMTIDVETGAFEYTGEPGGPQDDWHFVSTDGERIAYRSPGSGWREANEPGRPTPLNETPDELAYHVSVAAAHLLGAHSTDVLLPRQMRHHVELVQEETETTAAGDRTRYDVIVNTDAFAAGNLLEWIEFERDAVPNAVRTIAMPMTIWVDDANVIVRLANEASGWSWERIAYLSEPFAPTDPLA